MALKENILELLMDQTNELNLDELGGEFTANEISKVFNIKRNTVSHYLNQFVEENAVIKINTRPVYFFSKEVFEKKFFPVKRCVFESVNDLKRENALTYGETDVLQKLIGADGSLKRAIEQIKASVYYPGGLPIMLAGPTGVGKSYTVGMIYKYCIEKGILSKNAPFITFNCAQYANNPELLSSYLFGYTKGTFTGADATKEGLLAAADGGILFLDEVHRLNAESQEKLFVFMDQGRYRRMGESEVYHNSNVRLVFATTETLQNHFLQTFLRRIPIQIKIPSLNRRGEKEKRQFVYMFLINEAKKLHIPIKITNHAINALTKHNYSNNMGELSSMIKLIVASSFAKKPNAEEVKITLQDLPGKILEDTLSAGTRTEKTKDITIYETSTMYQLYENSISHLQPIKSTYEKVLMLFGDMLEQKYSLDTFQSNLVEEVNVLFDHLIFDYARESEDTLIDITMVNIEESIEHIEKNFNARFNGNSIYAMAYFLYYKGNTDFHWTEPQLSLINKLSEHLGTSYKYEQKLVRLIIDNLKNKLDLKVELIDEIILWIYLRGLKVDNNVKHPRAVILAHGYATASSIANVVNRLLGKNIFEPFDMPIDISINDIATKVLNYIEKDDISQGLIILVDMGSLKNIDKLIKDKIKAPVAIINNVSTQMALHLGSIIAKDMLLEEIVKVVTEKSVMDYKVLYPEKEKEKVIVTSCQTGMGTALQIKKLLDNSIPADLNIKIVAHDYNRLKELKDRETLFRMYDVIAIIGTSDPDIDRVPYISLEDIVSGSGEQKMREIFLPITTSECFNEINNNIVWNCSLERVIDSITILDSEKILAHVKDFVGSLELRLKKRLSNERKIGIYIHVSCLVERLIRREQIETYPNQTIFEQSQKEIIKAIYESFRPIESIYNVKINTAEIGYIYDYLSSNN